jgi:FixJ family two-component response regulator
MRPYPREARKAGAGDSCEAPVSATTIVPALDAAGRRARAERRMNGTHRVAQLRGC